MEISDTAKITGSVTGDAITVADGVDVKGSMNTFGQSAPQELVEKRRNENDAD